jgi:hypothetical protein
VPKLAAGASRTFTLEFAIHVGPDQVKAATARVAAIQGTRQPQVDREPEKID